MTGCYNRTRELGCVDQDLKYGSIRPLSAVQRLERAALCGEKRQEIATALRGETTMDDLISGAGRSPMRGLSLR